MSIRAFISWCSALWLAAGIETAIGAGVPGPLVLLAFAAGWHAGLLPGCIVGVLAGCCLVATSTMPWLFAIALGLICGITAALLRHLFSARNIIIVVASAMVLSIIMSALLAVISGVASNRTLFIALRHGGINGVWMIAIYSIILIISNNNHISTRNWEYKL